MMRITQYVLVIATTLGVIATVPAQAQPASSPPARQTAADSAGTSTNQWLASGFAGSDFGRSAQDASTNYGGTVGYLVNGKIGGELAVSTTPNFSFNPAAASVISGSPMVNTYMAHLVGAMPLGPDRQWQPYISGGIGGIQMRPDVFNVAGDPAAGTTRASDMRLGGDVGLGVMGFRGNFGFKADVRYFRATGQYNAGGSSSTSPNVPPSQSVMTPSPAPGPTPTPAPTPAPSPYPFAVTTASSTTTAAPAVDADSVVHTALTGLAFWRANVGLAFRW